MYRYNKTSIILKISIAVLFIIGMVLECSCERSEEPEKRGTGYITCTLRWDSVVAVSPVPEKLRYCIYPSEGGPMIQTDGNANGITLFLPPDKYNVLVFNYDAKNIGFRNMSKFRGSGSIYLLSRGSGGMSRRGDPVICRHDPFGRG